MTAMDPINPWIDPAETRRMAERLMLPAREPVAMPKEEAGFDDSFVGFSDDAVEDADVDAALPRPAGDEPPPPSADAEVAEPGVEMGSEFADRWDWLRENFSVSGFFVFDAGGELVFDSGVHGGLYFIARDFVRAGAPHSIRMRIRSNAVLELIPIKADVGNLCLGVVVLAPLSQDEVAEIRKKWLIG